MKTGIYKITNEVTGKFYIGSAKDIEWRWTLHRQELKANRHVNPKLQHSWNFYGEDKFTFIVIEETSAAELLIREQFYLDMFKPYLRTIGYNIGTKAYGGDNATHNPNRDKFIEKMKEICAGENNPMFGRKHTTNSIQKQKDKAKGRFTLPWFINKYGVANGTSKYEERRKFLSNRPVQKRTPTEVGVL
jgi:group I intron endonuclease